MNEKSINIQGGKNLYPMGVSGGGKIIINY